MAERRRVAHELLVAAVWHATPPTEPHHEALRDALALARRNDVEGQFASAFPSLQPEADRVAEVAASFLENLDEATRRLAEADVLTVLIKAPAEQPYAYSNFDLVVGRDGWLAAIEALHSWAVRRSRHPLEATKLLMHPAHGPAAHLHQGVIWFDVPVLPTDRLRAASVAGPGPWRVPGPADEIRILLAHAVFQNLALDLSELMQFRRRATDGLYREAMAEAAAEGWATGLSMAWECAASAVEALDAGRPVPLPLPLPLAASFGVGYRHAASLLRRGAIVDGLREALLRAPLIAAKRRRLALA